jgi:hypothetical protein
VELSAQKESITQLFGVLGVQYQVPVYQRPYAWEYDQIDDLWDDLRGAVGGLHFMGSVVLSVEDREHPQIIDGQQRLTTIALLLGLLRDELHALGAEEAGKAQFLLTNDFETGDDRFRMKLGINNRKVFRDLVLRGPSDGLRLDPASAALSHEERSRNARLLFNRERLHQCLTQDLAAVVPTSQRARLVKLLDTIAKRLEFVTIRVGKVNDAFMLFETLNDRGLQLSAADLLKNHLLARVAQRTESDEEVLAMASEWDGMVDDLGPGVDIVRFFRHFLLVRFPDVSKEAVYDRFKELVQSDGPEELLVELRIAAKAYGEFEDPDRVAKDEPGVRDVLRDLKTIRAVRCYVTLLPGRRWLSSTDFLRLARTAEILTYRHSSVGGREAKSLEAVYHRAARILDASKGERVDDALQILRQQIPSDADFVTDFMRLRMGVQYLVRYTFERIEADLSRNGEKVLKPGGRVHIEHIMPRSLSAPWQQALGGDAAFASDYLERWGNLTLLAAPLNISASNNGFDNKRRFYKVSEVALTRRLADLDRWNFAAIEARQRWLAEQAARLWSVEAQSLTPPVGRPEGVESRSLGLPLEIATRFQPLCEETSFQELLENRPRLQSYLAMVEIESGTRDIDVHAAKRIAEALAQLVQASGDLDAEHRKLVRGAVEYYLLGEDADADLLSENGFEDDRQVLNAVCAAVGRNDLKVTV